MAAFIPRFDFIYIWKSSIFLFVVRKVLDGFGFMFRVLKFVKPFDVHRASTSITYISRFNSEGNMESRHRDW